MSYFERQCNYCHKKLSVFRISAYCKVCDEMFKKDSNSHEQDKRAWLKKQESPVEDGYYCQTCGAPKKGRGKDGCVH